MNIKQTFGLTFLLFSIFTIFIPLFNAIGQVRLVKDSAPLYTFLASIFSFSLSGIIYLILFVLGIFFITRGSQRVGSKISKGNIILGVILLIISITNYWFFFIRMKAEWVFLFLLTPVHLFILILFFSFGIYFLRLTEEMMDQEKGKIWSKILILILVIYILVILALFLMISAISD